MKLGADHAELQKKYSEQNKAAAEAKAEVTPITKKK